MGQDVLAEQPAAAAGTSCGVFSAAIVQQQLRAVLGAQGPHLMGGEACILFKPGTFDDNQAVSDNYIRDFLQTFVEKFAVFAGKLATS